MRTLVYIVKPNDSVTSIAARFGRDFRDLVRINRQIPTKVVWYAGKPYTVFADLKIGQQLLIPENWVAVRRVGIGTTTSNKLIEGTLTFKCPPGFQYDANSNTCIRIGSKQQNRIPGVGTPGDYCYEDAGCGNGEQCSWGTCETIQGMPPAQDVLPSEKDICLTGGGIWDEISESCSYTPPPPVTPTCFVNATGCNDSSECCSGYCNTNIKNIPGAAGQCQIKDVHPPAIGVCKLEGDICAKDGDCCSSNCQGGVCATFDPNKGIASVEYPCNDYQTIIAVQEYLTEQFPPLANVGEWGTWGPADTWALNELGISFAEAYDNYVKEKGGDIKCTGGGPADVYCPGTQEFDPATALCVDVATKQPPKKACGHGYKLNSQGTACVPVGGNGDIIPVIETEPPKKEEPSGFPWGWVIAGVVVVAGGGTIAYYAMKDKKSTKTSDIPGPVAIPVSATAEPYVRYRKLAARRY